MSESDVKVVDAKIDSEKEYLDKLSMTIWSNPELAHKEYQAHEVLTGALENYGFSVQKEYFLKTAFRAEYSKGDGPVIAVMCEYDALPEIDHACGHNLIAESGVATGIAVKAVMDSDPTLKGKIVVLGTPAEEGGAGKLQLISAGAFKDIDAAMMVHPSPIDMVYAPYLCIVKVAVRYIGKEAHAAAFPWGGRNALDAAVAAYVNIGLLRQQMKPMWRIHVIITKGGTAPNVIPGEAKMELFARAPTMGELKILKEKLNSCLESAASATGCQLECQYADDVTYLNVIGNKRIGSIYMQYAEQYGKELADGHPELYEKFSTTAGSTDMGNVSYVVPSIHALYKIGLQINHTAKFTDQSATPEAHEATRIAAKAMALTIVRLMRNQSELEAAKAAFRKDLVENQE